MMQQQQHQQRQQQHQQHSRKKDGVPFKLVIPCRAIKVGVVVHSLAQLHHYIKEKFGLLDVGIYLAEDGTLVCDESYFSILEPQTELLVQPINGIVALI